MLQSTLVKMGVLYYNEHNAAQHCLVCGQPLYVIGRSKMPHKVSRHFPLIPRLKRMFRASNLSQLMRWHHENISQDGLVQHVANSKAWAHNDSTSLDFMANPCNLKLELALDGVNPYGNQSNNWSTWSVMIFNYNLLPWLTTIFPPSCWFY
jgi:hypothetical protein